MARHWYIQQPSFGCLHEKSRNNKLNIKIFIMKFHSQIHINSYVPPKIDRVANFSLNHSRRLKKNGYRCLDHYYYYCLNKQIKTNRRKLTTIVNIGAMECCCCCCNRNAKKTNEAGYHYFKIKITIWKE